MVAVSGELDDDVDEDVLDTGRRVPRRVRGTAAVLAALAVVTGLVVHFWRDGGSRSRPAAAASTAQLSGSASPSARNTDSTGGTVTVDPPPWPTAQGACGERVDLPIVS